MTNLLFELPAAPLTKPPEPIIRAAEVEGDCRWTLSRRWSAKPIVAFCGCNPSYADAKLDDPTLWRVMGFAFRWGYGGVVMLNVYPFITPEVAELYARFDGELSHATIMALGENIERVAGALAKADLHIACWGNLVDTLDVAVFNRDVAESLGRPINWHCLGTTASGAPTHPMARGKHRVPDEARPAAWQPNFKAPA